MSSRAAWLYSKFKDKDSFGYIVRPYIKNPNEKKKKKRAETVKFLDANIGKYHDTGFGNDFLYMTLKG
jgi:hypothetical protein